MNDRAYIVRVKPVLFGAGFRATVQDMTRSGVPVQATRATETEAIIAALAAARANLSRSAV